MSDEEADDRKADPVADQVAVATNGALQGALSTLAAAAVERDRLLDTFREQKERLEFQLQQQRAHAMNFVEQARAETGERTGAPSGKAPGTGQPNAEGGLKLSPDQQVIAGVKMLIYQDTRPYEVSTQAQTQSALLLLNALKLMIHQEIDVLFQRAQAQEADRQEAAKQDAMQPQAADHAPAAQADGKKPAAAGGEAEQAPDASPDAAPDVAPDASKDSASDPAAASPGEESSGS